MRALWAIAMVSSCSLLGWAGSATSFAATSMISSACANTPAAAMLQARVTSGVNADSLAQARSGYRVESMRWDPLLRQSWAVVGSCDHHDYPTMVLLMGKGFSPESAAAASLTAMPLVRVGDLVHLWKRDAYARIEMVAIAEQSGAAGVQIRLRLATPRDTGSEIAPPQYLAGVVRGPADVEIEP